MIRNIFLNPVERRLRAGWRLIIFVLAYLLSNILAGIVIGILSAITGLLNGQTLTQADIMNLMSSPMARIVSGLLGLVTMIAVLYAMHWIDRRPMRDYGFRFSHSWWIDFGFGLFLGAVLMVLIFAAELAAGWVTVTGTFASFVEGAPFVQMILVALVHFICVGIYEEMMSRGYLLRNLAEGLNWKFFNPKIALLLAYFISSAIFGLLHAGNPNATWVSTFNIFIAGLFLGLGFVLTGELAIPIGLHITWNFFQGNVFGFPVSGTSSPASFIAIQQGGPDLWTGGAFGPEAGIIGILAIALGSLLTVLWVRRRYGSARLQERLAIYQRQPPADAAANPTIDLSAQPNA